MCCNIIEKYKIYNYYMGIGDWGLRIGDWGFGVWAQTPNPKTPNPKPQPQIKKK